MTTKNLGIVKALHVGTIAPTNTNMIWLDTNLTVPLHKAYNPSSGSWEAFVYLTLIDNNTIKKDVDNKLYVDVSKIPELQVSDGSITLVKLADVATSTIFYRKTPGVGAPEVQTLATLKSDLGLSGTNTGDQDLTSLVQKSTTINSKSLSSNITLTPEDIGSPSGSGSSTGANTGDETKSTILNKLGIAALSGDNSGDQTASEVQIVDSGDLYDADNVEEALAEAKVLIDEHEEKLSGIGGIYSVTLSAGANVAAKISGATVPSGWTLEVGSTSYDIQINHNKDERVAFVSVFYIDGTEEIMLMNTAAYNGIRTVGTNTLVINSIATGVVSKVVKIYIYFV